jgi:hypothetical protein
MLHRASVGGIDQLRHEVHAKTGGNRLVGRVGDDVVDGVPRGGALAQGKGHDRMVVRRSLAEPRRPLLSLGQEETLRAEDLMKCVVRGPVTRCSRRAACRDPAGSLSDRCTAGMLTVIPCMSSGNGQVAGSRPVPDSALISTPALERCVASLV